MKIGELPLKANAGEEKIEIFYWQQLTGERTGVRARAFELMSDWVVEKVSDFIMGKKDKEKKKGKGAAKTAEKTEKRMKLKNKKELAAKGTYIIVWDLDAHECIRLEYNIRLLFRMLLKVVRKSIKLIKQ